MRMIRAIVAAAAVAGALFVAGPPVRAAGGASVRVAAPFLRIRGAVPTGLGLVTLAAKGTKVIVAFAVAKLPATVAAPLGVFVEDGPGAGTFTQATSIVALKKGGGAAVLSSTSGPPPALGVSDVADLVGRVVEVRDAGGTPLLTAKFPPLSKFQGTKVATKFGPTTGSSVAKLNAKLTGTPSPKTGSEKFLLKVTGLLPGVTYTLYMEDAPGSGVFVAAGDLVGDQFLRDQAKGDTLPLGAATLADLVGRAVELRDVNGTVGRGSFPLVLLGVTWPQNHVFVIDEPATTLDRYLRFIGGIVVYRSEVDLTAVTIPELIAEGESNWRLDPTGTVPGGIVCTVRLADNDRYWWQSSVTGAEHYLGVRNSLSAPSYVDLVKFILHFGKDVGGHRTAQIESFLYRGEFLVDAGTNLAGNGVRFDSVGVPVSFILR